MSNATQSVNDIVCNLNSKVSDLDALVSAIELMLSQISLRVQDPRCLDAFSERLEQLQCLASLAKERAREVIALGDAADGATVRLSVVAAA